MKRILLVEDNPASRRLIGDILRRAGFSVHEAEDADVALPLALARSARGEAFDLVVMDVQLPGTDGLTATRLLRRSEETRATPILAVTAHAMRGDEARILAAGCDAYVAKPISYKELLAAVERLLGPGSSPAATGTGGASGPGPVT